MAYGFYKNEDGKGFCQMERNCVNGAGNYESVAFTYETLCEIDGVALRKEGKQVVKYALTMDGDVLNRFTNRKTAVEMFLDFAGVNERKRRALGKMLMEA